MNNYNDTRYPEADYKNQGLPEYNDNPLIAALPMIMSPVDVAKKLRKRPDYHSAELNLESHIRTHAINRLTRAFFVPQTNHIVVEQKNPRRDRPCQPDFLNELHYHSLAIN